jgi:membrane-bound serine protease (ClpP class)
VRRLAIALSGLLLSGLAVLAVGSVAAAQETPEASDGAEPAVDIVEMSGLVDDVVADDVTKAIARAERDGAEALVIQLNSKGAVVSAERMARVAEAIHSSSVPVAIWVGPSGARALGGAGQLLGAAPVTAMAPASRLGALGDPLPVEGFTLDFGDGSGGGERPNTSRLRSLTMGPDEARQRGVLRLPIADEGVPVLRNMLLALDGLEYGGRTLDTAEERLSADGTKEQVLIVEPRFYKLPLLPRLMHTVASPPVTYLLLAIGLSLLIFEFFTAGVGVAGVVGAGCVVLAGYGLGALPISWWALTVLLAAFFGLAIDVQTGVPRAWTGIGLVLFAVGSLFLFRDGLRPSWITLLAGIGGVALAFVVGMPSMVRARFATPTIGREWMIGELGEAMVAIDPEGVALVHGAQWRARTNRATPLPRGASLRVTSIDGFTLEVEPEDGGARDHRERRRSRRSDHAGTGGG